MTESKKIKNIGFFIIFFLIMYVIVMNHKLKLRKDISEVSISYIGKSYQVSPLGEGDKGSMDTDPLIRYDAFDCQTFVETVLAERLAKGRLKFLTKYYLNKIRYFSGRVSFVSRNHIVSADWLPNNKWLLSPVENLKAVEATATINRSKWFYETQGFVNHEEIRTGKIKYIPFDKIDYYDIPGNSIIFVIKDFSSEARSLGTDLLVSHMGFAIRKGEDYNLFFRHASSKRGVILDEPFQEYFRNARNQSDKLKGIAIYKLKY